MMSRKSMEQAKTQGRLFYIIAKIPRTPFYMMKI